MKKSLSNFPNQKDVQMNYDFLLKNNNIKLVLQSIIQFNEVLVLSNDYFLEKSFYMRKRIGNVEIIRKNQLMK